MLRTHSAFIALHANGKLLVLVNLTWNVSDKVVCTTQVSYAMIACLNAAFLMGPLQCTFYYQLKSCTAKLIKRIIINHIVLTYLLGQRVLVYLYWLIKFQPCRAQFSQQYTSVTAVVSFAWQTPDNAYSGVGKSRSSSLTHKPSQLCVYRNVHALRTTSHEEVTAKNVIFFLGNKLKNSETDISNI